MKAVQLSKKLLDAGYNALPIIFPAVPENAARLRFFLTSEHTGDDFDAAISHLEA